MKSQLLGAPEMRAALRALEADVVKRIARGGVVAMAQPVKREAIRIARSNFVERSGALFRNIAMKRQRGTPPNISQVNIGVRHGRESKNAKKIYVRRGLKASVRYLNDPFYYRFHEFGTKKMRARPFIGPALESMQSQALDALRAYVSKQIAKYGAR